jgi:hypothetical protein
MTHQHHLQHDSASTLRRGEVAPVASSPARLSSNVASMTQHLHRTMAKSSQRHYRQHDSIALSLAWLDIFIAPRLSHPSNIITSMTRQHHHQHESTDTSHRGQVTPATSSPAWLDSSVASTTQHLHHAAAKSPRQRRWEHDSTALSPARLDIFIASWPSHSGSVRNQVSSYLVWLWWVIDLVRFEFESRTISFCYTFIFV